MARHGRFGCWLVAALGAGVCLLWAALRDGCGLVVAPGRACCCAHVPVSRVPERGAAFLARCGPMPVDLFVPSARPGAPRFVRVRGVARAPRDLPERAASRIRALLRSTPPPHREGVAALRGDIKKRRGTAGRSARQQGLRKQGRSHRFITAGCLRGRVAPPLRTTP